MNKKTTSNASIQPIQNGWRLGTQKGDASNYRDAQLDDYSLLSRHQFPHRGLSLSLRARTSSNSATGTWGFGLWNDPFGLSLGFGGSPFRLPTLPNAVWFFYSSPHNYLSFRNDKPSQGFLAQTFRSPKFHSSLFLAGLAFPFSHQRTRKILSNVIREDSAAISLDVTQWNKYRLEWEMEHTSWYVNDALIFESTVSPKPPLGVIIWIDNQYAAFTPKGKISFGVLDGEEEWLEVADIRFCAKEKRLR